MYVVTSKVMANRNRIEKYVFYDTVTNGMILKTPAEANQLLDKNMVAGLHKHGAGSTKPTSYFKHIGVIGEKDVKAYKTVIRQKITACDREYDLVDSVGNISTMKKSDLIALLESGEFVNGVKLQNHTLMVCKQLETIIKKEV